MAKETVCTECGRIIGVIPRWQGNDRGKPAWKVAAHASAPRTHSKVRRPRCLGTGFEVPPAALIETSDTPYQRKNKELAQQ